MGLKRELGKRTQLQSASSSRPCQYPSRPLTCQKITFKKFGTPKHCLRLKRSILHRKLRAIIPNKSLYFSGCEAEGPLCFSQWGRKKRRQIAEKCILSEISPVRGREKKKTSAADRQRRRQRARESCRLTWLQGHVDSVFLSFPPPPHPTHYTFSGQMFVMFPGLLLQWKHKTGGTHSNGGKKQREEGKSRNVLHSWWPDVSPSRRPLVYLSEKKKKTKHRDWSKQRKNGRWNRLQNMNSSSSTNQKTTFRLLIRFKPAALKVQQRLLMTRLALGSAPAHEGITCSSVVLLNTNTCTCCYCIVISFADFSFPERQVSILSIIIWFPCRGRAPLLDLIVQLHFSVVKNTRISCNAIFCYFLCFLQFKVTHAKAAHGIIFETPSAET